MAGRDLSVCGLDVAERIEPLTNKASAAILGSISASSDTVESQAGDRISSVKNSRNIKILATLSARKLIVDALMLL
jgi:hypothetical protein